MKVSVALCTYNGEQYIGEQIQIIKLAQKKINQGVALRERIKLRALQLDKEVRRSYHEIFIKQ